MEFAFGWLIFAALIGVLASSRGRSGFGWFLLSLLISPLIAMIVVLILQRKNAGPYGSGEAAPTAGTHVRCPDCRELVRRDARKCKHCGSALNPS